MWQFTEKVDGANIRIIVEPTGVRFGGKTDNAQLPSKLVERLRAHFDPQAAAMVERFQGNAVLYGEGYGAGIQSGGIYRPDQDFILFDVRVGQWWLQREAVNDVAKEWGLRIVPTIGSGTLADAIALVKGCLLSTMGVHVGVLAEGIVARPAVQLLDRNGVPIMAKIKHKDFHK